MSGNLDLASHGYQIEAELGRNREGGRITWKGIEIKTEKSVVVKQFCFAQANSSWSGYKAYERELEMLQKLRHPNIPQYVASIETEDGFCLVQEYIEASDCKDFRPLQTTEIDRVAEQVLDVLIYLQQQNPPIIHRDISPANILLDEALKVYVIDFGFARPLGNKVSTSSIFCGTPGFIAPEQVIQSTIASDIYSLGVTLVCLFTRQDIAEICSVGNSDDPYQLNLLKMLPDLEPARLNWLAKMTEPKVSQRFADAKSARLALTEISLPTILSSDEEENEHGLTIPPPTAYLQKKIVGGVAIVSTTSIATWGVNFTASRVELSWGTIAIAILATMAIAVSQVGGATIASSDSQAKTQSIVLATIIPIVLVALSAGIWGKEEAVIITSAIAIGEVFLVSYFWGQLPTVRSGWTRGSWWLSAISVGIFLGLKLI